MSNVKNINSNRIKLLHNNLKRTKRKKSNIYYIPKKKFKNENAIILGHTYFKNPNVGEDFFVYDGSPFKLLNDKDTNKNIQGYIPVSTNEFVAFHKNHMILFIWLLLLLISSISAGLVFTNLYNKPPKDNTTIDSGGFDVTDDTKLRENSTDASSIYITGYDHLFLTGSDSYIPLYSSEKNKSLVKFEIYTENMELLYSSINVEPGKEDRYYHNGNFKEGDTKIIIKIYEVIDNNTLGNGGTYSTIVHYKTK